MLKQWLSTDGPRSNRTQLTSSKPVFCQVQSDLGPSVKGGARGPSGRGLTMAGQTTPGISSHCPFKYCIDDSYNRELRSKLILDLSSFSVQRLQWVVIKQRISPISTVRKIQNFSGHRCHRRWPLLLSLSYLCLPVIRVKIKHTCYVHMYICTYILKFVFQSAKRR